MIFGNIHDENQLKLLLQNPDYKVVFDYLKKGQFDKEGTFYIDNEMKVIRSTGPAKEYDIERYEAHKKFIDLHYVIEGVEEIYIAPINTIQVLQDYNPEKDVEFGRCDYGQKLILRKGDYCITFPEDAHRPACGHGNMLDKFCFKIAVK